VAKIAFTAVFVASLVGSYLQYLSVSELFMVSVFLPGNQSTMMNLVLEKENAAE
jgi:hypothetical protein